MRFAIGLSVFCIGDPPSKIHPCGELNHVQQQRSHIPCNSARQDDLISRIGYTRRGELARAGGMERERERQGSIFLVLQHSHMQPRFVAAETGFLAGGISPTPQARQGGDEAREWEKEGKRSVHNMPIMAISGESGGKSGRLEATSACQRSSSRERSRQRPGRSAASTVGASSHHTWSVSQPVDLSIDDGHLQRPASPPIAHPANPHPQGQRGPSHLAFLLSFLVIHPGRVAD